MKNILIISDNERYGLLLKKDGNNILEVETQTLDFKSSLWIDNLRHLLNNRGLIDKLDTIIIDYCNPFSSNALNTQISNKIFQTLHTIHSQMPIRLILFSLNLESQDSQVRSFLHTTRPLRETKVKSVLTNCNSYDKNFSSLLDHFTNSMSKSLIVIEEE